MCQTFSEDQFVRIPIYKRGLGEKWPTGRQLNSTCHRHHYCWFLLCQPHIALCLWLPGKYLYVLSAMWSSPQLYLQYLQALRGNLKRETQLACPQITHLGPLALSFCQEARLVPVGSLPNGYIRSDPLPRISVLHPARVPVGY